MRFIAKSAGAFCAFALLAGGLAGCGPDYAIFAVKVTSATPRNDIEVCVMNITDENGVAVVKDFQLERVFGTDSSGQLTAKQGCSGGITPANVGTFSYSTSRSSGTLNFRVDAYSSETQRDDAHLVESASNQAQVKAYPPEISVEVGMQRLPGK
jgi:hypothetical protein